MTVATVAAAGETIIVLPSAAVSVPSATSFSYHSVVQPCSGKPGKRFFWKEKSTSTTSGRNMNV